MALTAPFPEIDAQEVEVFIVQNVTYILQANAIKLNKLLVPKHVSVCVRPILNWI